MSKVSVVQRNKKRERLCKLYEKKRAAYKQDVTNLELPAEKRFESMMKLAKLPRNSSPARVVRRCEITGKPKGVYRKFGLCRNVIRELAAQGMLPGLKKSSW